MSTSLELLAEAASTGLVLVSDVIDRPHMVHASATVSVDDEAELSPADCRRVSGLIEHNLAEIAGGLVLVPWYGAATAHGHRIVPTATGLAELAGGVAA